MSAWSLAEIRLIKLSGWKGYMLILLMALKPLMHRIDMFYRLLTVILLILAVAFSAYVGLASTPPTNQDVSPSWARRIESQLDDHERRLQSRSARQDLADQRMMQYDQYHKSLDDLHLAERLAVQEKTLTWLVETLSWLTKLVAGLSVLLIPIAYDSLKRVWKR